VLRGDDAAHINRLTDILVAHGCKSLSVVNVQLQVDPVFSSRLFPQLSALERLRQSAGSTANIPINVTTSGGIHGFFFVLPPNLPPFAAPFFTDTVKKIASEAKAVFWDIDVAQLPALDTPTEDDRRLISSLTFGRAERVNVSYQDDLPPSNTPAPDPVVLRHLQPDAFPLANELNASSTVAVRHMIEVMPQLKSLYVRARPPSPAGEVLGLLKTMGSDKKLGIVGSSVEWPGEGGVQWGEERDLLPEIGRLSVDPRVPDDPPDIASVAETVAVSVESLIALRGLSSVGVHAWGSTLLTTMDDDTAVRDGIQQEVDTRFPGGFINGFRIRTGSNVCGLHVSAERCV